MLIRLYAAAAARDTAALRGLVAELEDALSREVAALAGEVRAAQQRAAAECAMWQELAEGAGARAEAEAARARAAEAAQRTDLAAALAEMEARLRQAVGERAALEERSSRRISALQVRRALPLSLLSPSPLALIFTALQVRLLTDH